MSYNFEIILLTTLLGTAKGAWDYYKYKENTDDKDQFMAYMFGTNPDIVHGINIARWMLLGLAAGIVINIIAELSEYS